MPPPLLRRCSLFELAFVPQSSPYTSIAALTGVDVYVIIGFALRGRLTVGQLTLDQ